MKKWNCLAIALISGIASTIYAGEYEDAIEIVERWIPKKYSTVRAQQSANKKFDRILNSQLDEAAQIAELKKQFPEAFTKSEALIYQPPLSWTVHSLALGYDISESATQEIKVVDVFQTLQKNETNQNQQGESQVKGSLSGNIEIKGGLHLSWNPLKWLSGETNFNLGAAASGSASQSSLWSQTQQDLFRRQRDAAISMVSQTNVKNLHLTFTVTFTNRQGELFSCDLSKAGIPVYMGAESCNKRAIPFNMQTSVLELPPHSQKDVTFRMDLDTTTARKLVTYMGNAAPTIDLTRGTLDFTDSQGNRSNIIERARERVATIPIQINTPDNFIRWDIRRFHGGSPTTLREALSALDAKGIDPVGDGGKFIDFDDDGNVVAISQIPIGGTFASNDIEKKFLAFFACGGKFYDKVDKSLLDAPFSTAGYTVTIVTLDNLGEATFPIQQRVFQILQKQAKQGNATIQCRLGSCYYKGYGIAEDYAEAVKWFHKAAEQGYGEAQSYLGVCYYKGEGVAQDYAEAVKWFRKAAEQEYVGAQSYLGVCYYKGTGVAQDYAETVKWFRKAAEQEYAVAQYFLGLCYYNGIGVTQDYAEAVKWFRKAAGQGLAQAQYNLGICYGNGNGVVKDPAEAVKWFRKAAEQGNADAQNSLGVCYDKGRGVAEDYNEAVKWYRNAAEQEHLWAQYNLGSCYYYGRGVAQDYTEAVKWYSKAAEQGHVEAQNILGVCYYDGRGVAQDYTEAVKWYRKAAEQGYAWAQFGLGLCHYVGKGVAQNYAEAVKWNCKAAEQGVVEAQSLLGACYFKGIGVQKNYEEAAKWLKKAAERGNTDAQTILGNLYSETENYTESVRWYRKAAEQGEAEAQYRLGLCYCSGHGVTKDFDEAIKWFRKAAEQGNKDAKQILNMIDTE